MKMAHGRVAAALALQLLRSSPSVVRARHPPRGIGPDGRLADTSGVRGPDGSCRIVDGPA